MHVRSYQEKDTGVMNGVINVFKVNKEDIAMTSNEFVLVFSVAISISSSALV